MEPCSRTSSAQSWRGWTIRRWMPLELWKHSRLDQYSYSLYANSLSLQQLCDIYQFCMQVSVVSRQLGIIGYLGMRHLLGLVGLLTEEPASSNACYLHKNLGSWWKCTSVSLYFQLGYKLEVQLCCFIVCMQFGSHISSKFCLFLLSPSPPHTRPPNWGIILLLFSDLVIK